jgi:glycosyltransferase involved in cell wall biosynthesis
MVPINPRVSVIIPLYNGAAFLADALDSVAAQTYRPLDIMIIDDGSTDESAQIAAAAQIRFDLPIAYHFQCNQGPSAARNYGIEQTDGEFVAFLDADDVWLPRKIAQQVAFLSAHKDVQGAVCHFQYILEPGTQWPPSLNRAYYDQSPPGYLPSALLARRALFGRIGCFDPCLRLGEDTDWFLRARDNGVSIGVVPEVLWLRRFHASSLSYSNKTARAEMFKFLHASLHRRRDSSPPPA